jgi:hypothetical protein
MAASQMWQVKAPTGTDVAVFRASKGLYEKLGTELGVEAIQAGTEKITPTYAIGELLKVGWLQAVNVYYQKSTNKVALTSVYCAPSKVDAFIAKCRTDDSGLVINGKAIVSASRPRRQSFS